MTAAAKWGSKCFFILSFLVVGATSAADVKVFVTNDVHSHIFERETDKRIGYALLQGRIEEARREGFDTFLLDAGDLFPLNAHFKRFAGGDGKMDVAELIGKMGYNVLAPGNHEFDDGVPYYNSLIETASRFNPSITVSCLNLTMPKPPHWFTNNPVVLSRGKDFRLVVLGIIYPGFGINHNAYDNGGGGGVNAIINHKQIKRNLIEKATEALAEFNRPGDVVIILSHIGKEGGFFTYAPDQIQETDLAAIPNVDFIMGGHSHNIVEPTQIGTVWYGNNGGGMYRFTEITLTPTSRTMKMLDYDQVKNTTKPSLAIMQEIEEIGERYSLNFPNVGCLTNEGIAKQSIPLGRLIGKAMQAATGADLSIIYRYEIPFGISKNKKYRITDDYFLRGRLITFSMTGREIVDFFRQTLLRTKRYFPQFHGMTVHAVDRGKSNPLEVIGIRDGNGDSLDPAKDYTVAIGNVMTAYRNYSFNLRKRQDYGDLLSLFMQYLKNAEAPFTDSLRTDSTLIIHPTAEKAEAVFAGN